MAAYLGEKVNFLHKKFFVVFVVKRMAVNQLASYNGTTKQCPANFPKVSLHGVVRLGSTGFHRDGLYLSEHILEI